MSIFLKKKFAIEIQFLFKLQLTGSDVLLATEKVKKEGHIIQEVIILSSSNLNYGQKNNEKSINPSTRDQNFHH